MAECIDSVSFALLFFSFLFNTLCFATPLFTSQRIPSTLSCHFFLLPFSLLPYKKKKLQKENKNTRRSQEESNGSGGYEVSALYVFTLFGMELNGYDHSTCTVDQEALHSIVTRQLEVIDFYSVFEIIV